MMDQRIAAIGLCLIQILCSAIRASDERGAPKLNERVDQFLGWLPPDTETVIVSQSPFEVTEPTEELRRVEVSLRIAACGITLGIHDDLLRKELKGQKIVCAVEGSCRFRGPKGLGEMPYDGCEIVCFSETAKAKLAKAFQTLVEAAAAKDRIAGQQIAVFNEKFEDDDWSVFIAHPRPEILLCATERGYIKEVLERMTGGGEGRALPGTLPEWSLVNVKAPVWAVRHYQKGNAPRDPSSPLNKKAAANQPDPAAVGFVFWFEPGKKPTLNARYLSNAKNAAEIVKAGWEIPTEGLMPRIQQTAAGVVDISAPFNDEEASRIFFWILLGYLGHAVYV